MFFLKIGGVVTFCVCRASALVCDLLLSFLRRGDVVCLFFVPLFVLFLCLLCVCLLLSCVCVCVFCLTF